MDIGLVLPTIGPGTNRESLEAGAAIASELGWKSVWVTDHLMVPHGEEAVEYGSILEAIVSLTHVAARFESLRIGTSVIVPPMRNPVILAKQFATLDLLSGGRLIVGVGVADRSDLAEFQNLGVEHRMEGRGAFVDETIALWRHLWSGAQAPFKGEFFQLTDYVFSPLPPQGSRLPIWTGGRSAAAMRRAALLADGYHAARTGPGDIAERIKELKPLVVAADRPLPTISVRARVRFDQEPTGVYSMCGSTDQVAGEVRKFAEAGIEHLIVVFEETDPALLSHVATRFQEACRAVDII
jgi:probable F420-dependent oxidoreductase